MPKTTKEVRSRVARSTSSLREPEIEIDLEVDDARLTTPFVRALGISEHRPATEAAGVIVETRRPERRSPTRRSTPQFGATPLGVERPMRFGDVVALVGIVLALTGYGVGLLEVLAVIIVDGSHPLLVWARGHEVANERPPPEPGFRRGDDVTFYTTARGCTYVVLDATGRPCLIPCDHTPECDEVEVDTPSLCALAEAADQIDAELEDGWYALRFVLFFREGSSTRLVYPTEHGFRAITIAEVPVGAVRVDVVPEDAVRCVSSPRAPVSGGDHG